MSTIKLGTRIDIKQKSGIMHPYQLSEAKESFVLTEPKTKDYASEYNALAWFQKIQSLWD